MHIRFAVERGLLLLLLQSAPLVRSSVIAKRNRCSSDTLHGAEDRSDFFNGSF